MIPTQEYDNELKKSFTSLVDQRRIGFAWLDEKLVSKQCFGQLSQWIPINRNICQSTPLFMGLERELLHLQDEPESTVTIPKVGLKTKSDDDLKLSIEIMWQESENQYILTLYNINAQSDLDHELAKQVRARRIAEENYQNAKKQVNEQRGLLELIMDHASSAIAVFDHNMQYKFATHNWLRLYGLENEPVIGRDYYQLHQDTPEIIRQTIQNCQEGRHITLEEEQITTKNNRQEWIRLSLRPWKKTNDSIGGIIMAADILTAIINKGQELEHKNAELDRVNKELEEFASIISHDLKAPLRAIKEAVETLKPYQTDQTESPIAHITQQSDRIVSMLDDLFEYSHINKKSNILQDINLKDLLQEIMETTPGTSGFNLICKNIPDKITLPLAPFDLIIRNLVDNAVKHHDLNKGTISISMEDYKDHFAFHVCDNGPGISNTQKELIFQPFQKNANTISGNGIGLALVKKAVELHGGKISVKTPCENLRGTQFTFTWPKH